MRPISGPNGSRKLELDFGYACGRDATATQAALVNWNFWTEPIDRALDTSVRNDDRMAPRSAAAGAAGAANASIAARAPTSRPAARRKRATTLATDTTGTTRSRRASGATIPSAAHARDHIGELKRRVERKKGN
jgi:hypothetical protein